VADFDLKQMVLALSVEVQRLKAENEAYVARIAELEREQRKNSTNSSAPPSCDPPDVKRPKRPPSKLKRGGQPGHEGHRRELAPPERVDRRTRHPLAENCEHCGESAAVHERGFVTRQWWEIPEPRPVVAEAVIETGRCACCRRRRRGVAPEDMPAGCLGPRAQALAATLTGAFQLSRREAEKFLAEVMGIEVSLGTISNTEAVVSEALGPAWQEAKEAVQASPVKHVDETGNKRAGESNTSWIASTPLVAVFLLGAARNRKAFLEFIGIGDDVTVTDRYAVYDVLPPARRQLCWAHILRAFKFLLDERDARARRVGRILLHCGRAALHAYKEHQRGKLNKAALDVKVARCRSQMDWQLAKNMDLVGLRTLAHAFWLTPESVWLFLTRADVSPTNNLAERDLRRLVIWKKTSFGTASVRGDRFAERMLTVVMTCRKQARSFFHYVVDVVRGADAKLLPSP
jgi:transposase